MIALIDADVLTYRVGFASQDVDWPICRWRLDDMINRIMDATEASDSVLFLTSTDKSNFRFEVFKEYKANRVLPKPKYYAALRDYMIADWDAQVVEGQEADDALGQAQTKDTIICTTDKDLDMIPGWHHNFVKHISYNISDIEAIKSFYWQCLVGDKAVDNIEGCPGIGKTKATRMLEGCQDEMEMYDLVVRKFRQAYPNPQDDWAGKLALAGKLLWIRQKGKPDWVLPNGVAVSKKELESYLQMSELNSDTKFENMTTSSQNSGENI